ncbi:MAG: hypothetical protein U0167_17510 [bacterium]
MSTRPLRTAFGAFHVTLGVVVLVQSVLAVMVAARPPADESVNPHLALVAGVEALGALLFLLGKTVRIGGVMMLATFAAALGVHGIRHGMPLLVYAAGTIFVMVHGSLWPRSAPAPTTAA